VRGGGGCSALWAATTSGGQAQVGAANAGSFHGATLRAGAGPRGPAQQWLAEGRLAAAAGGPGAMAEFLPSPEQPRVAPPSPTTFAEHAP
jgi:hypothetical protein